MTTTAQDRPVGGPRHFRGIRGVWHGALRVVDGMAAVGLAVYESSLFLFAFLFLRGPRHPVPARPSLLYVGYTTLDNARRKGLLKDPRSAEATYNPNGCLSRVTVFVPIGERSHHTQLSEDVSFVEVAHARPQGNFRLTYYVRRLAAVSTSVRSMALQHDAIMVGGPNLASMISIVAKFTTRRRFVCAIEALWEELLPVQDYMSPFLKKALPFWYKVIYRCFDAYTIPYKKYDFYAQRGMKRDRMWPFPYQLDITDLERAAADACLPSALKSATKPWIVTIGRLEEEKLSRDYVDIAKYLRDFEVTWSMILVGDGSLRSELSTQLQALGLGDSVILVGAVPHATAFAIAQKSDYCVSAYTGNALTETLAAGCCVVAYDNDPHRAIAGEAPIRFVPDRDTRGAATALADLMRDPVTTAMMQRGAMQYARDTWSLEAASKVYVAPIINHRLKMENA